MVSIALLNQKGGVGKSTLAVHLASAGHLAGLRTLLVDLDRQGSSLDWAAARPEGSRLEGLTAVGWNKPLAWARYREMASGYELVVLDGPPRLSDVVRSAALVADVIVLPVTPGGFDLWAVSETLDLLAEAGQLRSEMGRSPARTLFVVNRATNTRLSRAAPETLTDVGTVCPVVIGHRVAFAAAVTAGDSVLVTDPSGPAAKEVTELYRYVSGGAA
jgi:chromosome partitioning protein